MFQIFLFLGSSFHPPGIHPVRPDTSDATRSSVFPNGLALYLFPPSRYSWVYTLPGDVGTMRKVGSGSYIREGGSWSIGYRAGNIARSKRRDISLSTGS